MEMVQYQKVLFLVKKVECSLFDQKWLILGPSGQKSFFFKKSRSSFDQYKNLNHIKTKKIKKIYIIFLILLSNF